MTKRIHLMSYNYLYICAAVTNQNFYKLNYSEKVAESLLKIQAIKLSPSSPFTWASGLKSPIYCDNRLLLSYPKIRSLVINAFADHISQYKVDLIAGVATAGIAHGALLAQKLDLPFVYVRSKAKGHGRQNQIEGELTTKENVLMIEDLISTGGSVIAAAEALRSEQVEISAACAIFSYGFDKAAQNFEQAQLPFSTITEYQTLLEVALELNYISSDEQKMLTEWRADPAKWSEKQN